MTLLFLFSTLSFAAEIKLTNSDFQPGNGGILQWRIQNCKKGNSIFAVAIPESGAFAAEFKAESSAKWMSLGQRIGNVKKIFPESAPGKIYEITLEYMQKSEKVKGHTRAVLEFFDERGARVSHWDGKDHIGDFDWKTIACHWKFKPADIPGNTQSIGIAFYLNGTGTTWIAMPQMSLEIK